MIWLLVLAIVVAGGIGALLATGAVRRGSRMCSTRSTDSAARSARGEHASAGPPTSCTIASRPTNEPPERAARTKLRPPVRFGPNTSSDRTMNLGAPEILVILVVALLVFGPHRLPEIGRQVGGAMRELRKMQDSVKSEINAVMREETAALRRRRP